jgi:thioredoxin reductase (NADPH)
MENTRLNIPGENQYFGLGVSYCIKCDQGLTRNKSVVVVGNQKALDEIIELRKIAKEITLVINKNELTEEKKN